MADVVRVVAGSITTPKGFRAGSTSCGIALDYMTAQGVAEAMLYVDATNTAAVKLYVALGFTVNHIDRAYTGDVPPATTT